MADETQEDKSWGFSGLGFTKSLYKRGFVFGVFMLLVWIIYDQRQTIKQKDKDQAEQFNRILDDIRNNQIKPIKEQVKQNTEKIETGIKVVPDTSKQHDHD